MGDDIPLVPLHKDDRLLALKLDAYRKLTTEVLLESLRPGEAGALKTRPDGTILDGHHRLKVLRERGIDVNRLPREIVPKAPME
jgi:hypothetical protein